MNIGRVELPLSSPSPGAATRDRSRISMAIEVCCKANEGRTATHNTAANPEKTALVRNFGAAGPSPAARRAAAQDVGLAGEPRLGLGGGGGGGREGVIGGQAVDGEVAFDSGDSLHHLAGAGGFEAVEG